MKKYHVNPYTAVPGVCYAKDGNCPFGGDESHYSSYEEAQDHAFYLMEDEFNMFEDSRELSDFEDLENVDELMELEEYLENSIILEEDYDYLYDLSKDEIIEEIYFTTDKRLLDGIITQQIEFADKTYTDDYISAAVQNKHVPSHWVTDAIANPDDYNDKFIIGIINRPTISESDLFGIAENTTNVRIRDRALSSKKITRETIVLNIGEDGLADAPELALHLNKNPNCPPLAKENANKRLVKIRSERMYGK